MGGLENGVELCLGDERDVLAAQLASLQAIGRYMTPEEIAANKSKIGALRQSGNKEG